MDKSEKETQTDQPERRGFIPSRDEVRRKKWRFVAAIIGIVGSTSFIISWNHLESQRRAILLEKGKLQLENPADEQPAEGSFVLSEPVSPETPETPE